MLTNQKESDRVNAKKACHVKKAEANNFEPQDFFIASLQLEGELERHSDLLMRNNEGFYYVCYLTSDGKISLKDKDPQAKFALEYKPDENTARILTLSVTSQRRIYLPNSNQTEENTHMFFRAANAAFESS